MVKRIITAAVGIPIGIFILYLNNAHILAGVTALLSVMAVHEILTASKYSEHKAVSVISIVFSFVLPLVFCYDNVKGNFVIIGFVYLISMFCAMLCNHKNVKFEEFALICFVTVCVPLGISTLSFFIAP